MSDDNINVVDKTGIVNYTINENKIHHNNEEYNISNDN